MNNIVEKLHENRQVEVAKEILESAGYNVSKKLQESVELSGRAADMVELLEELPFMGSSDIVYDIMRQPEEYNYTQEGAERLEQFFQGETPYIMDSDVPYENEGVWQGDSRYYELYEPLQYASFYRGTTTKVDPFRDDGMTSAELIKSSVGPVLLEGGEGVSAIFFNEITRKNIIQYIKNNVEFVNNFKY